MNLQCMDPEKITELLKGHKDVVTPLATARDAFYREQSCPSCGSVTLTRSTDSNIAFRANDPIARYVLSCQDCSCVFDPHTGIVLRMGNRAKVEPAIPILPAPET